MRKLLALALAVAVPAAVSRAPLVHAHPDDHATAHHGGRAVHAHWAAHVPTRPDPGPALGPDDHDRAVSLSAFVAVAAALFQAPAVMQEAFGLAVPAESDSHRGVEMVHSHGPPLLSALSPRAPPVRSPLT